MMIDEWSECRGRACSHMTERMRKRRVIHRITLHDTWEIIPYSYIYSLPLDYSVAYGFDQYISCSVGSDITGPLSGGKKAVIPLTVEYPTWLAKYGYNSYGAYFNASIEVEAEMKSSGFSFTGSTGSVKMLNYISSSSIEPVKILAACGRLVPDN